MATTASGFIWYELMTTDMAQAAAFYSAVVGWKPQAWEDPATPYTIMNAGDRGVAGIMKLPPEAAVAGGRPGWIGYIHARDVDAATEQVRQAGGTVHRAPADIPKVGRFSVVADPQGAIFMLMTPLGPDMPPVRPDTPGHIGWRELHAADGASAFAFYAQLFGWTKAEAIDMGPMGIYQLFAAGGDPIGGMLTGQPGHHPFWLYYFSVDAADSAVERVGANGGTVLRGPHEVPGGSWIVHATDPHGALFALVAPRR